MELPQDFLDKFKTGNINLHIRVVKGQKDFFEYSCDGKSLEVRGNSLSSCLAGAGQYLKTEASALLSWEDMSLPETFPPCQATRRETDMAIRLYMNPVTYSYSTAWWDWNRWKEEIDWMALNGINYPLALMGQEYIWRKIWRNFGLTEKEISSHFAGPSFLPFQRMGIVNGHGGPLPESWIEREYGLQKKILERMRQMGMTPVLPAFAGNVPDALAEKYGSERFYQLPSWNGFERTWQVKPADPLFGEIGSAFIAMQQEVYGTDHVYMADPFIEVRPLEFDETNLNTLSQAIYDAMAASDDQATWIMQGWPFGYFPDYWTKERIKSFLDGPPKEKLIIIELNGEEKDLWKDCEGFFGNPWIWSTVDDYGKEIRFHGKAETHHSKIHRIRENEKKGNLAGIGMTMEGIEQNSLLYDLTLNALWNDESHLDDKWLESYLTRRYGRCSEDTLRAWNQLMRTVYSENDGFLKHMYLRRPEFPNFGEHLTPEETGGLVSKSPVPNPSRLMVPTALLIKWAKENDHPVLKNDVIILTVQILGEYSYQIYNSIINSRESGNQTRFADQKNRFLQLILYIDGLADLIPSMRIESLLQEASRWGRTEEEKNLYKSNARMLITVWGKEYLYNYAAKPYSGLLRELHYQRWNVFFDLLEESMKRRDPFDFDSFDKKMKKLERDWCDGNEMPSSGTTAREYLSLCEEALSFTDL